MLADMSQSSDWTSAARVVRRMGFGATGREVDAAVERGISTYVTESLAGQTVDDPGVRATPLPHFDDIQRLGRSASASARKRVNAQIGEQLSELTEWWLHRMIAASNPVTEKLTFIWHSHFATSAAKVRTASAMAGQNEKFRSLGLGGFRPLAYAMLTDPAMLRWLDGQQNTKKAPNENLAREFMELFALGHGNGYDETDVREGARALTGWRTSPSGTAALRQAEHDSGTKTVLGVTGPLDAAGFCDAVLGHPASAGFVASRLWQRLAGDAPPSPSAARRLTSAYGPERDLRALFGAILTDPELSHASAVQSPVEWLVGAQRALQPNVNRGDLHYLATTLRGLGQLPFYPPDVGGWPSGQAWLSTAATEIRWDAAMRVAKKAQSTSIVDASPTDRIDAAAHLLGVGKFSDRTTGVLKQSIGNPVTLTAIALNSPEYLTVCTNPDTWMRRRARAFSGNRSTHLPRRNRSSRCTRSGCGRNDGDLGRTSSGGGATPPHRRRRNPRARHDVRRQ